jgi:4-hydroxy-tetrahydrodipicolinate synthase
MNALKIPDGALTALVTPFREDGDIDWIGFNSLVRFQTMQGISGIVPTGTTGETSTLDEDEHELVISSALKKCIFVLSGCGSNCTKEATHYVDWTADEGGKAVLLVDPYYNGPSSLELRKEYYGPIAEDFPDIAIVPYIIPGRTGCALSPEDLVILSREFQNVCAVKEATGDLKRMKLTRALTPPDFQIFSGDDEKTFEMMTSQQIRSCGVISVVSNIAPAAVQKMCRTILENDVASAELLCNQLAPLFKIVTVVAGRNIAIGSQFKTITDKFRNPLPIKTAMNGLGMPAGPCRQPLGKMSMAGVQQVRSALATVWRKSPEILQPIEEFFDVKIAERLANQELWASLAY